MPTHIVVVSHGLWGSAKDVKALCMMLNQRKPDFVVVAATCNEFLSSYDGIETCGTRLYWDIKRVLDDELNRSNDSEVKLSVIGYSAGGLFLRYAVTLLDGDGYFRRVTPWLFLTIATPHLGAKHDGSSWQDKVWNGFSQSMGNLAGGLTATQNNLRDGTAEKPPLLVCMSLTSSKHFKALSKFRIIRFFANAKGDRIVGYQSAAVSADDPYKHLTSHQINAHLKSQFEFVISSSPLNSAEHPEAAELSKIASEQSEHARTTALRIGIVLCLCPVVVPLVIVPLRVASWCKARRRRPQPYSLADDSPPASDAEEEEYQQPTDQHIAEPLNDHSMTILSNLRQLNAHRVDCCLPDRRAHASIIMRRPHWPNGRSVLQAVCYVFDAEDAAY